MVAAGEWQRHSPFKAASQLSAEGQTQMKKCRDVGSFTKGWFLLEWVKLLNVNNQSQKIIPFFPVVNEVREKCKSYDFLDVQKRKIS